MRCGGEPAESHQPHAPVRYFYETRTQQGVQSRRAIVEQMTVGLQEAVCEQVTQIPLRPLTPAHTR